MRLAVPLYFLLQCEQALARRRHGYVDWSSTEARIFLFIVAAIYIGALVKNPRRTIICTFAVAAPVSAVYGAVFALHEEYGFAISVLIGLALGAGAYKIVARFMKSDAD